MNGGGSESRVGGRKLRREEPRVVENQGGYTQLTQLLQITTSIHSELLIPEATHLQEERKRAEACRWLRSATALQQESTATGDDQSVPTERFLAFLPPEIEKKMADRTYSIQVF